MLNEGTYWTTTVLFIRLPESPHWTIEIKTYDGQQSHTVTQAHGIGMLDEYVLNENLDIHNAVCHGLAVRTEGVARQFRQTLS